MDILIIENDTDIRRLLADALDGDGYRTVSADFDALPPDAGFGLVLTDLPEGAFSAAAAREWVARLRSGYAHARIVIMTAHRQAEGQPDRLGADALIAKPFDVADLFAVSGLLATDGEDRAAP